MEIVKQKAEYTIYKKRSGRHAVKDAKGRWINNDDKVKILTKEKIVKLSKAKAKPKAEEAPAEDASAETGAAETKES